MTSSLIIANDFLDDRANFCPNVARTARISIATKQLAVIMRPQQYHDAGLSFGDSPENGRLIYINTYY